MPEYSKFKKMNIIPRLPLEGNLDITYRCNNNCLHCWLKIPAGSPEKRLELTFNEIKNIADQARSSGCRKWNISGGEPLLRPDFPEIFEYLTARSTGYTLNTNGTLLTPEIARLLKRKGVKLIALYGATKETYDSVTRHPGGFEMAMRGFRYLQEAGAGFTVQLIPMRANWHEWDKMKELAESLSKHFRVGAPWLYPSSCRDEARNIKITSQRLDPRNVVELDQPSMSGEEISARECEHVQNDDRLFARCIAERRDFHVDPYGGMTFCALVKDPAMRYDLRSGTFKDAWEIHIPSLADKVRGDSEYRENCGTCADRNECRWCPVFGWLEHGRYTAPVKHLCEVTRESRRFKEAWKTDHRRYFRIAGITIQVDSDLAIDDKTFQSRFDSFRTDGPGDDTVTIHHHFDLPDLSGMNLGRELYRRPPWAIYRQNGFYHYVGISPRAGESSPHKVATFNVEHTRVCIYNNSEDVWLKGNIPSLTLFPSDQIMVARLLADRQGCYLHSAGAVIGGKGILFVGHSRAGKSTLTKMLIDAVENGGLEAEILCDDRNIVRHVNIGWRVYGSWSHGEVPLVSADDAPLRAICFLEKATVNMLTPLHDHKEIIRRLLACVIKPFVTADWWHKTLELTEKLASEVPCYTMRFDRSDAIVEELSRLVHPAAVDANRTNGILVDNPE
jgi:MoaA/NifB/PqqE/SkfB family radical SAM enzyme